MAELKLTYLDVTPSSVAANVLGTFPEAEVGIVSQANIVGSGGVESEEGFAISDYDGEWQLNHEHEEGTDSEYDVEEESENGSECDEFSYHEERHDTIVCVNSDNDMEAVYIDRGMKGEKFERGADGRVYLEQGMIFVDVYEFREALKDFTIQEGFEIVRVKNEKSRVDEGRGGQQDARRSNTVRCGICKQFGHNKKGCQRDKTAKQKKKEAASSATNGAANNTANTAANVSINAATNTVNTTANGSKKKQKLLTESASQPLPCMNTATTTIFMPTIGSQPQPQPNRQKLKPRRKLGSP